MPAIRSDIPVQALLKRFSLIYLPVVIILSIILLSGARFDQQLRAGRIAVREGSRVEIAKGRVTEDLSAVATDLRVIANLPLLHEYLDSGNPAQREELEKVFLVLARETQRYDQVRYIDASGQEVIRINYNAGKPAIVPHDQLQNKSGRYYFSDTIELDQGDIFVSPLDLNIEHGSLEIPYKPMIRYGTPVFDSAGRKKGIILLNYFGNELLQDFRAVMQGDNPHSGMLLNRDGYWLSGPNREDEWGFMLGKTERTFGHDYPEAWRAISAAEHGSLMTDQGLFIYTTAYPLLAGQRSSTASTLAHARSQQEVMAHEYYWKIVSFVPHAVLSDAAFYNQPFSRILLAIVYLLLALASFVFARVALGRKLAKQEIVELNIELEQRVAERTAGEENLSVTLNSIGDGVMATDAQGRVTRLNAVGEQLTGWMHAEAVGRPVAEIFHIINRDTRQPAPIPVAATLKQGALHGLANDTVLIARDGSERPIADSCAPIRDRDGEVIGAVLVFRDVTKEYAAQVALSDSATRIQTVLNAVADGILTINERGTVETINPAATRIFGYAAAEVIGHNIRMLMPEPYHSQHDDYIGHYVATGEARIIGSGREVTGLRKDGSTFPMDLAVSEMRLGGERHFTGVVRDITARKQTENAIITAREEADTANRAKSTFLATMSHEIRTPMNGVLGMLELLSLSRLDAEQRTTLEVVRESGKSLLRIIDDILDFSKIEAGKLELRPEVASIKEIVESVHSLFTGSASSKGLLLRHSTDPRISAAVLVDPIRLRQILNNFVSNALKFTPRGGTIELTAKLIERVDGIDRVRFSVMDTGIGVSAEQQRQLFQPFSQIDSDTTRRYGGSGLGLTICLRLAKLMHGAIEMVSEPGKGTTMILTLPLSIADAKSLPTTNLKDKRDLLSTTTRMRRMAPGVAQAEAEGTLVLLVDDHPTNRLLLIRQVKALGYAVESADNGVEALGKWKQGRFGMVITDCNMPEMDGYELARSIRKLESAKGDKRIPIIACTANALEGEAETCFAAGMDDYVAKPIELKELLKKLDQWLPIPAGGASPAETFRKRSDAPAPEAHASAPVDNFVLAQISGGDSIVERDILLDFRRVNDEDTTMLKQAVARKDMPQVTRASHRIKGASRIVGAIGLAGVCERMEHASRANDWPAVEASMGAFHEEWMRLNAYLDSL
jgi:two-component system, NarL family, sensor histidine kinase EvgS